MAKFSNIGGHHKKFFQQTAFNCWWLYICLILKQEGLVWGQYMQPAHVR